MTTRQKSPILLVVALFLLDGVCIAMAYYLAAFITWRGQLSFDDYAALRLNYLAVFIMVWCGAAIDQRLFISRRSDDLLPQLFAVTKAFIFSLMVSVFVMAIVSRAQLGREFLFVFCTSTLVLILLSRTALRLSLWGLRLRGWNTYRIIVIGANNTTVHMVRTILSHEQYGYHIEGFLEDDLDRVEILQRYNIPYLGKVEALEQLLVSRVIDIVYIVLPVRSFYETIQQIAHLCEGVGVPVRFVADPFPLHFSASTVRRIDDVPLLSLSAAPEVHPRLFLRRVVDWIASSILLVALFPLFIIIAVLIKWDSPGPIFAYQERVRRDGYRFRLMRFRFVNELTPDGMLPPGEFQLSRLGSHLRRYNLDALPNLFNVWLGQMSFSGPRPPLPPRDQKDKTGATSDEMELTA